MISEVVRNDPVWLSVFRGVLENERNGELYRMHIAVASAFKEFMPEVMFDLIVFEYIDHETVNVGIKDIEKAELYLNMVSL